MIDAIVRLSIRRRGLMLALATALLILGVRSTLTAKLDVFPDFVQPQAVIQTEAPGFSPEQVESLVTRPIEGVVSGITNLESVRSQSIQGLSIVTVVFKEKTDIFIARQLINEQLTAVVEVLPAGVKPPRLTPLTSATMDLLKIGLTSDHQSLMNVRDFADWVMKPRLQAVEGVANVGVMGGDVRQLQIQIDPERLEALGVSTLEVIDAARQSTGAMGAGFIETANQRIVIQSEGQSLTPEQIGGVVVTRGAHGLVRLGDVAEVCEAPAIKYGGVNVQGRPGVLLKVLSQYGSNTMDVTRGVEAAIEDLKPALAAQQIELYPRLHRPATFIETALHHIRIALYVGAGLVLLVLMAFLMNARTCFISIIAIPLSLLTAIIVMQWLGYTLNTITLGGLAIAIGEVVDDAIIDVENILRRMRENRLRSKPRPFTEVVHDASLEVRSAVVYATFVVVMVFIPVLTMSGLQGRLFAPLAVAYILAILASLAVALTVTPALSCVLLTPRVLDAPEPRFQDRLRELYQRVLLWIVPRRRYVVGACAAAILLAAAAAARFGESFLPEFREGHFVVQINAAPGMSLTEMMRLGARLSHSMLTEITYDGKPVIDTIEQQAGRAELGEDPWGPHRCELHVELKPNVPGEIQAAVQQQMRDLLGSCPGIDYEVTTFLGDRIGETLTGETSPVVVSLFGENLDALDEKANEIARLTGQIRGAEDVRVASGPGSPQLYVALRRDRLADLGFQPLQVLDALRTAHEGLRVAQTYEGNRAYDVVVIMSPSLREEPEQVGSLLVSNKDGRAVRLHELADVTRRTGRYVILHDGGRRRQAVTCGASGRDVASFVAELKAKVAKVTFPPGTYATFGGSAEAGAAARNELFLDGSAVGLGIVLLLLGALRNARNLLLVLLNIPLAFVGGVAAVAVTEPMLSLGTFVGFVTLFGITMRNSVMMMSHWEHLVLQENEPWNLRTALRGASERLAPILMTALVTGLGLLPIALGAGEVGREIEGPMAIVILGGLVSSTALNLILLPSLALQFARFRGSNTEGETEPT